MRADAVDAVHLFLAFDGFRLYVASASHEHHVSIDGVPVAAEWTHVRVPSLLTFGSASIAVACDDGHRAAASIRPRPIIDLSRGDRQPTQVMDLSSTLRLHTARIEVSESLLAELRAAPAPEPTPPAAPTLVAQPISLQRGDTLIFQPGPALPSPYARTIQLELEQKPAVSDLVNTLYDGGALRERAAGLASEQLDGSTAPRAQSVAVPAAKPLGPVQRRLAAFRNASRPKQLTIALLPLAIAGLLAMNDGAASATSTRASQPKPAPAAIVAKAVTTAVDVRPEAVASSAPSAVVAAAETAAAPHDPGERLALIAAFSGNKTDAAGLYERLAVSRNSRVFALAARLVRDDRVRKP